MEYYLMEIAVFVFSIYFTYRFFREWYRLIFRSWPPKRNRLAKRVMGWIPIISFAIILYILRVYASYDVVDSVFYTIFYLLLGFAWLYFGIRAMALCFDLSLVDDVFDLDNRAALFPIAGGVLALTLIYGGANVGDGPGWWCVIFAGGLGMITWLLMGMFFHKYTNVFERITVERDIACSIRCGLYLLSGGMILGKASSGDWTSFAMTIVEFLIGWPVVPLTILAIFVEHHYLHQDDNHPYGNEPRILSSLLWGWIYLMLGFFSVALLSN